MIDRHLIIDQPTVVARRSTILSVDGKHTLSTNLADFSVILSLEYVMLPNKHYIRHLGNEQPISIYLARADLINEFGFRRYSVFARNLILSVANYYLWEATLDI